MGLNVLKPSKVEQYARITGLPIVAVGIIGNNTHKVEAITSDHRHLILNRAGEVIEEDTEPTHWYATCRAVEANPQITAQEVWEVMRK